MKEAGNIIAAFLMSIAQFIIGFMILAGKADLNVVAVYYIVSSSITVLLVLIVALAKSIRSDKS